MKYLKLIHNIFAIAAFSVVVQSCNEAAYPAFDEGELGGVASYVAPIQITISPTFKNTFYVYSFRSDVDSVNGLKSLPNLKKLRTEDSSSDCLIDDGTNLHGMRLYYNSNTEAYNLSSTLYYSKKYQSTLYNFFAYTFPSDIAFDEKKYHRESDKIYYDIQLDGYHDILGGYAKESTSNNLARLGRQPILDVNHLLARLFVAFVAGDSTAENIKITNVEVKASYNGKFIVASRNKENFGLIPDSLNLPTIKFRDDKGYFKSGKYYSYSLKKGMEKWYADRYGDMINWPLNYIGSIRFNPTSSVTINVTYSNSSGVHTDKILVNGYFKAAKVYTAKLGIYNNKVNLLGLSNATDWGF